MTGEAFFGRAATLFAVFAAVMVLMYVLSACQADAEFNREQGRVCVASGRTWDNGLYQTCRATPSPSR